MPRWLTASTNSGNALTVSTAPKSSSPTSMDCPVVSLVDVLSVFEPKSKLARKEDLPDRKSKSAPRCADSFDCHAFAACLFGSLRLIRLMTMALPSRPIKAAAAVLISASVKECHGDNAVPTCAISGVSSVVQAVRKNSIKSRARYPGFIVPSAL